MRKLADVIKEQNREDPRDLRSRSDAKRERKSSEERLARLAALLVDQSEKTLAGLDLPEAVLDSVLDAQKIQSAIARNRQLRVVRQTLRKQDADGIQARLESVLRPERVRRPPRG